MKTIKIFMIVLISGFLSLQFSYANKRLDLNNITQARFFHQSVIEFYKNVEKNQKYEEQKFVLLLNFLSNEAYASSKKCFFGGWPSQMQGKICKAPWTHGDAGWAHSINCKNKSNTVVTCNNLVDVSYNSCGSPTKFRCSPLLFGDGDTGEGTCIETGGTYYGLTQKCVDQTKNTDSSAKAVRRLLQNPELVEKMKSEILAFCGEFSSTDTDNDHTRTCMAFRDKMKELNAMKDSDVKVEEEVQEENAKEVSQNVNRALGILDACQKDYDQEQDSGWDKFFSSRRKTLSVVSNSAACHNDISDSSITNAEIDKILETSDNLAKKLKVESMLSESIQDSVELTVKNYLLTMHQFYGEGTINIANYVKENAPYLLEEPYAKVFFKSIKDMRKKIKESNIKKQNGEPETLPRYGKKEVVKDLNEFSAKLNKMCNEMSQLYSKNSKLGTSSQGHIDKTSWYESDSQSETLFYNQMQAYLDGEIQMFMQNDKKGLSRLFATEHFRDNIFSYNSNMAKKCSRGDIDDFAFEPVGEEDIKIAMEDYAEMMKDDLEKSSELAGFETRNEANENLKEMLKYKPYLVGNYLKSLHQNPELQEDYAKYVCGVSRDIYNSDENWRGAEVTIGGLGLVASGILAFTGVGTPLGTGLAVASSGLVVAETSMAYGSYNDSLKIKEGAGVSFAQNQISLKSFGDDISYADEKQKEAVLTAASAAAGPLLIGMKHGYKTYKTYRSGKKGVDAAKIVEDQADAVQKFKEMDPRDFYPQNQMPKQMYDEMIEKAKDLKGEKNVNFVLVNEANEAPYPNFVLVKDDATGIVPTTSSNIAVRPSTEVGPVNPTEISTRSTDLVPKSTEVALIKEPGTDLVLPGLEGPKSTRSSSYMYTQKRPKVEDVALQRAQKEVLEVTQISRLPSSVVIDSLNVRNLNDVITILSKINNKPYTSGDLQLIKKDIRKLTQVLNHDKLSSKVSTNALEAVKKEQQILNEMKNIIQNALKNKN